MVRVVRATLKELENAVTALRDGELVAFPTETVYGLGANAQNPAAVRRIFELKERPGRSSGHRSPRQSRSTCIAGRARCPKTRRSWRRDSGPVR